MTVGGSTVKTVDQYFPCSAPLLERKVYITKTIQEIAESLKMLTIENAILWAKDEIQEEIGKLI